ALDHLLDLSGQFVARDEDGDLRPGTRRREVNPGQVKDAVLALLLRLVAGGPLHCLLRLPETGRAFDQQVARGRLPLFISAPKEEPFDDFAQPVLGLLGREESGAESWRQRVQDGPTATARQARGGPGNRGLWLTMPYLKPAHPVHRADD